MNKWNVSTISYAVPEARFMDVVESPGSDSRTPTNSSPERIVTIEECSSILVEFVREDQIPLIPIEPSPRHGRIRRLSIDQAWKVGYEGDLSSRIDTAEIVSAIRGQLIVGVM